MIIHRTSVSTLKRTEIPYQQIRKVEIVDKELNVRKTILEVVLGGVALLVVAGVALASALGDSDPMAGF